ncbi:hypothetical protein GYMLUDRAFT_239220 [Collybiopsis luxurians FD-317 M1]|nr:hypothetical protein GYMLUDRAFT_239220 [Collybiopsis luxurians FD-317 M1]
MSHRYRGHRAESFYASDVNELVEIRARQRTFYGAYFRTALGNLGYALTILRLFDSRFYKIGLLFTILGALLFVLSFLRDRHSRHDFADPRTSSSTNSNSATTSTSATTHQHLRQGSFSYDPADVIQTVGQKGTRVFGRPFVTAGWIVVGVAGVVLAVEIGLLVLILQI